MSDPITVLRDFVIDATCDLPESDYKPEHQALADVEALLETARAAERKLRFEYHLGLAEGKIAHEITDESWAEGEALAEVLARFNRTEAQP